MKVKTKIEIEVSIEYDYSEYHIFNSEENQEKCFPNNWEEIKPQYNDWGDDEDEWKLTIIYYENKNEELANLSKRIIEEEIKLYTFANTSVVIKKR